MALGTMSVQAQDNIKTENIIKVGDVIELSQPDSGYYKYVKFPKENIIRKRGGIADFSALNGEKLVVTEIKKTKNDHTEIEVERQNGMKFFNAFPKVSIHFEEALEAGEINIK